MDAIYRDLHKSKINDRLLNTKAHIFFYCFWYNIYFEISSSKFLKYMMWIKILKILKHNKKIFTKTKIYVAFLMCRAFIFFSIVSMILYFDISFFYIFLQIQMLIKFLSEKVPQYSLSLVLSLINLSMVSSPK